MGRPASRSFPKTLRASDRRRAETRRAVVPPPAPTAASGSVTCGPRRGFSECGVCFVADSTVQMLAFHWQSADVGSSISVPLCVGCRRKTMQVLREADR